MTLRAMTLPEPRLAWRQRLGRAARTAGEWALYAALTLALAELILG
jgi:hypothetical protein